jgi:hypothetical protein
MKNNFTNALAYEIKSIHLLDYELLSRECSFIYLTNGSILLTLPNEACSAVDPGIGFLKGTQQALTIHRTKHVLLPSGLEVLIHAVEHHDETEQQDGDVTVTIPASNDCHFATAIQCQQEGWYGTYEQTKRGIDQLLHALEQ